ncbi:beta-glucosidase [Lysinibacillus sp. PLM2]|nr:beta-glucosidase [Lysinibacillus sp. PLM2]
MVSLKKLLVLGITVILLLSLAMPEIQANGQKIKQPELGFKIKKTLTIDGLTFKDLNGNKTLDPYEDWRLSADERAKDLVWKMTLDEKAGLLLIPEFPKFENGLLVQPNEQLDQGTRYFIFRDSVRADVIANYHNQLQEAVEWSRLGIPVVMISYPRNHVSSFNQTVSPILESSGQFSFWPNPLGLAATRDVKLIEDFARITSGEFRATGIRKLFGYSANVATDPLWFNVEETFGEHPALTSDIISRIIKGYQGNHVSTTIGHYPGGGVRDLGKTPQLDEGLYNRYTTEGSLLRYHLVPFKAAIKANTTSIMPYIAYPSNDSVNQNLMSTNANEQFEEVSFALNKFFINDYLRGELGFSGYINADLGTVQEKAWGAIDLTPEEKYAKALLAGTNIFSGGTDPMPIIQAVNQGLVSEELVDQSAQYLITEMMELGLFENPYVDPERALEIVNDSKSQEKADEAHRKSIVLLKNNDNLLPLTDDKLQHIKLYVEMFPAGENGQATFDLKTIFQNYAPNISITDNMDEATHAFILLMPKIDPLSQSESTLTIGPDTGIENVYRINEIQKKIPTILAIDFKNPWLINEFEPNAASIVATFGVKTESLIDVLRGKFNPVGKLPFTIPADSKAVKKDLGDVPGFREDPSYIYRDTNGNEYKYNYGLSY